MKVFIHRKGLFALGLLLLVMLAFLTVRLVFAVNASRKSSGILTETVRQEMTPVHWPSGEARKMAKQVYWLEQKLELAKSDSISLVIDLTDSIVGLHLKGMDLYHSAILKKYPGYFLSTVSPPVYRQFARVSAIKSEVANVPKKPIKKVKAPKNGEPAVGTKTDTIPNPGLIWQFTTENNICVIITGVKMAPDSTFKFHPHADLLKYNAGSFFKEAFSSEYSPKLYLWLNDADAKSIYRAIPEKGKVLFRN